MRIPNFFSQPDLVLRLETLAAANRLTVRVRVRACRDPNVGRRYAIWTVDGHRLPHADFPASLSLYSLRSLQDDSSFALHPSLCGFHFLCSDVCVHYWWFLWSLENLSCGNHLVGFRYLDPCRFCTSLQLCLFGLLSEIFCCLWWLGFWVRECRGRKWGHFPQMIESDSIFAKCARKSSSQKSDPFIFERWSACLSMH